MAIYHLSAKLISRSAGRSATGAAAYRSGEEITDERTGLVHDYTRKSGVDYTTILTPEGAPDWMQDRSQLWNAVERVEIRRDAQLAREVEVALPRELAPEHMQALVTDFAQTQFVAQGMIADIALHHLQGDNPHAHILLTTRRLNADGFGPKCRDWNRTEQLQGWRQAWESQANQALAKSAFTARIDHRTLEAQGIDRIPQIHLGPQVMTLEMQGIETERGNQALDIEERNAQLRELLQHAEALSHEYHREIETSPEYWGISPRHRTLGTSPGELGGRDETAIGSDATGRGTEWGTEPPDSRAGPTPDENDPGPDRASDRQHETPIRRGPEHQLGDYLADHRDSDPDRHPVSDSYDRVLALAGTTQCPGTGESTPWGSGPVEMPPRPGSLRSDLESHGLEVDRTYLAVRRQLQAMDCSFYDVGIRRPNGQMLSRNGNDNAVLSLIPWLKRENAKGADIYIRPLSNENEGIILLDDLNQGRIADLKRDGLKPAAVVETSPYNYQAWIRLSEDPLTPPVATQAARNLAHAYDADLNSADWRHYGRLAGFTNRKPEHTTENGLNPYVLAHECPGQLAANGGQIVQTAETQVRQTQLEAERNVRLEALTRPLESSQRSDPVVTYRNHFKSLLARYGSDLDYSRADWAICRAMGQAGYIAEELAQALNEASPELLTRKLGHQEDYVERTVAKVMELPEVKAVYETPPQEKQASIPSVENRQPTQQPSPQPYRSPQLEM